MKNIRLVLLFTVALFIMLFNVSCSILNKESTSTQELSPSISAETNINNYEDYYELTEDQDGNYILKLFDIEHKTIFTQEFPIKEPHINNIGENLIEIKHGVGSSMIYSIFYNMQTYEVSDPFFNVECTQYGRVAYMDFGKLIVRDIFDESTFYKEVVREFSESAIAADVLLNAEFLDENRLRIDYLVGEDFEEIEEIVDLS